MYSSLSEETVVKIRKEVEKIKKNYGIINPIIRKDIFELLDNLCVVLRYPLDNDEEANGIHVKRWIKGEQKDFVFINTSNSIEKQIYTAAHELGHVWEIDEKVLDESSGCEKSEAVINRFAAELLMPYEIFKEMFLKECDKNKIYGMKIENKVFMKIIILLMNTFMVPYKAIIYRIEEIGYIDSFSREQLEELEKNNQDLIKECINFMDCPNILKTDGRKSMSNLYNMLEEAEHRELIPNAKIESIRDRFSYKKIPVVYPKKEEISIKKLFEENQ